MGENEEDVGKPFVGFGNLSQSAYNKLNNMMNKTTDVEEEHFEENLELQFIATNKRISDVIDLIMQQRELLRSIKADIHVIKTRLLELEAEPETIRALR